MRFFRVWLVAAAACLTVSVVQAENACDKTGQRYRDCVRLVDSLRPDKAGQMRVFAADGSEYNAPQVQWMKGQLRKFERLCASGNPGDAEQAARILGEVEDMLRSHRRRS